MVVDSAVGNFVACALGAGKHIQVVEQNTPQNIVPFLKVGTPSLTCGELRGLAPLTIMQWIFSVELTYGFVIMPLKCSILMLYIRLFGFNIALRKSCYTLIAITVAWFLASSFAALFQCHPVSSAWNPRDNRSHCINLRAYLVGINVPNTLIDFAIL